MKIVLQKRGCVLIKKEANFRDLFCRYKFIVDGVWVHDHSMPAEQNAEGQWENVVKVRKGPFFLRNFYIELGSSVGTR